MDFNGIIHEAKAKIYLLKDSKELSKLTQKEKEEWQASRRNLLKKSKEFLENKHIEKTIEILEKEIEKLNPIDNLIIAVDGVVNSGKLQQQKERRFLTGASNMKDEYFVFDGNSITPGTKFMINLDKALTNWMEIKGKNYSRRVIYSSHLVPGEGEHKIFDYIRRGDLIKGDGLNVIHGQDNDLIILSVLCKLENMVMLDHKGENKPIVVDELREVIVEQMSFPDSVDQLLFQDFCTITTLFGNDFLHKFPNVLRLHDSFPIIFTVYGFGKRHLTDEENNIIWKNYLLYLTNFNRYKGKDYFYREYLNANLIEPYLEIEKNFVTTDEGVVFDKKQFKKDWYSKQFNEKLLQWDGARVDKYSDKLINDMCINYLQTVQWVQYYYTKGLNYVSNYHYYHYIYNPLMDEVITVLKILTENDKTFILRDVVRKQDDAIITPVHHLISVLPYSSNNLLPRGFKGLYNKYMTELNPRTFEVTLENAYKSHQKKPIIPGVNVPYVDDFLKENSFKLPKNLAEGKDLIVFKVDSSDMEEEDENEEEPEFLDDKYSISKDILI